MTYKGEKIEEPTLEMIKEHIEKRHLAADPLFVYEHYKKRNWKNNKGRRIRSVEIMIGGVNALFINKVKTPKESKKPQKQLYSPYDKQLETKEWRAFRRFIFEVRGHKCEKCGTTHNLQIHHPKYKTGHLAWEYTCNDVIVVCRDCHKKIHNIK